MEDLARKVVELKNGDKDMSDGKRKNELLILQLHNSYLILS
jgi:hypothetical protein